MTTVIDLIVHALTGIRTQIVAYHQMRAQATVFIAGLGVAAAGFTCSHRGEAGWAWAALAGPMTFLSLALFLSMYFRQLLDVCQAIEAALLNELKAAIQSPNESTLAVDSAVYYNEAIQNMTDVAGNPIRMRLWHDATQHVLIIYILAYLIFWLIWFKPWK